MRLVSACLLLALAGCHAYYTDINGRVEQRASGAIDQQHETLPPPTTPPVKDDPGLVMARFGAVTADREIIRTSFTSLQPDRDKKQVPMLKRLEVPEGVLGYKVPDIQPPPLKATEEEKKAWLAKQFPPLMPAPQLPAAKLGSDGQPVTLTDLQRTALRLNPSIRQAHLDIEAARGAALQAKLYPNPTIGYEASTTGQGNNTGERSPGQQGGFIEQQIVTAGKLNLAHQAALREIEINEQKLRQTEADVEALVRRSYFDVLAAQKNFETTRALTQLIDELYNVLLLQFQVGEVAAYEPMQIRVLAVQARGGLVQAHNRYVRAWKQLAATLGTPNEPLTALAGRIDMAVPQFDYDTVLAFVLANNTELRVSQIAVDKARFQTRLEEVQPYPNPNVHVAFQKDYTTPPFGFVANISVGVPFPLYNRNQGNIQTARAQLARAMEENRRVENDLASRVAEVFERYQNNRTLLELYRKQILPNQVQAFRASVARHTAVADKAVSYYDLVNSQQTLSNLINSYLVALSDQWVAVVDIAHLLQTRDVFQLQGVDEVAPIPDMYELMRERWHHKR